MEMDDNSVRLRCMVSAHPEPQITWYKNGEELRTEYGDSGKYQMSPDGRELLITDKNVEDTARYTCLARNLAGEAQRDFDVEVHGKTKNIYQVGTVLESS